MLVGHLTGLSAVPDPRTLLGATQDVVVPPPVVLAVGGTPATGGAVSSGRRRASADAPRSA